MSIVIRECTQRSILSLIIFFGVLAVAPEDYAAAGSLPEVRSFILRPENFKHYVDGFNAGDEELYPGTIRNADAWAFLRDNVPLLDCPDKTLEEIYYFRWWTYRKHIKKTADGFVITEFLPDVSWAGKDNTINCAAGLHIYEGRWLHGPQYLDAYDLFWLRRGGSLRAYSFWIADALWNRFLVSGDSSEIKELLPDLMANYHEWEKSHLGPDGLLWQIDDRDGMEKSVGGSGYRATINSYMFADARAISNIADLLGKPDVAAEFGEKAAKLKQLVQTKLWNKDAQFFETIPRNPAGAQHVGVRELHGYTPWYVDLPDAGYEAAWNQLLDPQGFHAPFGPTTVEQRCPRFALTYTGHECKWDGPSWPFSTSITLTAMANLLDGYPQNVVSNRDYFELLSIYAKSQHLRRDDGKVVPWIDENLNPLNGDWMARTIMHAGNGPIRERGKDYNHSTFCDLIINGLVGLRPRSDGQAELKPLIPDGIWDYFCLDAVRYHGRMLTILYDKTGERYGRGKGLRLFADGREIASSAALAHISGALPTAATAPDAESPIKRD